MKKKIAILIMVFIVGVLVGKIIEYKSYPNKCFRLPNKYGVALCLARYNSN